MRRMAVTMQLSVSMVFIVAALVVMMQMHFVNQKDFEWAVETAAKKKKIDCSSAEFLTIDEGLCVQIMHLGSFDDEPATVALMDEYLVG